MALRPHRRATIKQLVRLSEQHWNAPRELAEILAELRQRDESEAEPIIHSIARRLSVLNFQPEARTQAEADGKAERRREEARTRRRQRILLALFPAAAAAAVAAWLLWPEKMPPTANAAQGGLDVAARGERAEPKPPEPAIAAERLRSPGTTAGEPVELAASTPPKPARDGMPDAPPASLRGRAAEMFAMALPPLLGSRDDARRLDSIGPNILGGRVRRPAEGGVYIGQARLRCYETDSDPEACGRNLWGGNTRSGPFGRPRPEREEWRAARAEFQRPRPPEPAPPRLAETREPEALPPPPGRPGQPGSLRGREPAPRAAAPRNCPAPPIGRTVFILDGSLSMGLPLWVGADLEDQLDRGMLNKEPGARRRYRELLAEPGPKRITRAREAFAAAATGLPSWVELGLVAFRECKDIRKVGIFEDDERARAVAYVRSLIPRGRTPIAQSLRAAATMLGDGPSSIILLTDGREFCGGDPCAAAAEIHARYPHTPINVVDISGQAKAQCIAEATGGRVYTPGAGDDLARVVHNAFRGADAGCPIYAGDNPAAGRTPATQ